MRRDELFDLRVGRRCGLRIGRGLFGQGARRNDKAGLIDRRLINNDRSRRRSVDNGGPIINMGWLDGAAREGRHGQTRHPFAAD